ncbi:ImmA/IrrE family metallo-endopeptidase [Sporosarcina sp. Marseille-Q4943]|uniref:ImmA/IrrE family metallo-endopeptidase n=1 Tax=Sporosarcina sp. Marseille-Q4943 TaxID=2942204 RepID=UPI00208DBE1A|nr:ImmA/IrrE family metallo-endopeptidase [Sporosarcina sp. Marseille-Q4943]
MTYESLIAQYPHLVIKEVKTLPSGLGGLYMDDVVLIDKNRSHYEKHCILAEEIGHYETTYGDITDLQKLTNLKLELAARRWGYEKIVSLDKLIECYESGFKTVEEVCTHLEVTEDYLMESIAHYHSRFGVSTIHKGYEIFFDPLYLRKQ